MVIKHAYSTTLRQWPTFSFLGGVPRFWRQIMAAEPRKLKSRRLTVSGAPANLRALKRPQIWPSGWTIDDGARIFGELGSWLAQRLRKVPPWGEGERIRRSLKKPLQNSAPLLKQAAKIGQLQTRPFSGLQLHTDFIFSGDCGNPGLGNCSLHQFLEILESARPNLPLAGPIPSRKQLALGPWSFGCCLRGGFCSARERPSAGVATGGAP